jgi:hypothetical protein
MEKLNSSGRQARERLSGIALRCLATASLWALLGTCAIAQQQGGGAAPSKTACKGWDNSFLTTFHMTFVLVLVGTFALSLCVPLVAGRLFWWITASRMRIFWITSAILVASVIGTVIYPRFLGLGNFGYTGISPRYLDCEGMSFGATGLFSGLIGRDVAAISQWPAMILLLVAAALAGGLLSLIVSETLVKSMGITSKVSGGEM